MLTVLNATQSFEAMMFNVKLAPLCSQADLKKEEVINLLKGKLTPDEYQEASKKIIAVSDMGYREVYQMLNTITTYFQKGNGRYAQFA